MTTIKNVLLYVSVMANIIIYYSPGSLIVRHVSSVLIAPLMRVATAKKPSANGGRINSRGRSAHARGAGRDSRAVGSAACDATAGANQHEGAFARVARRLPQPCPLA